MVNPRRGWSFGGPSTVPLVVALLKNRISREDNLWKILQGTTSVTHTSCLTVPVNFCIVNCDRVNCHVGSKSLQLTPISY